MKYIIIPEWAPLWAFKEVFGPEWGPLEKPTPCPESVIGKLLKQSGKEKVTIYETKFDSNRKTLPPVQLNLDNYMMPYEEIIASMEANDGKVPEVKPDGKYIEPAIEPEQVAVNPVIVEEVAPIVENTVDDTPETVDTPTVTVTETPSFEASEEKVSEPEVEVKIEENVQVTVNETEQVNKYAGMTKAERKAARRAEAAAKAAEEASKAEEVNIATGDAVSE